MSHIILTCSTSFVACLALSACGRTEGQGPPPNALESPAPESQIVEFMVTSVIWIVVILPVLSSI